MEFNEKLQALRKQKGLTQEELAARLYVSRTAVSKWESGRGYPNMESLKAIAQLFSVTLDELLSSGEVLTIAEQDRKQSEGQTRDAVFGLTDLCMSLMLFLPLFGVRINGEVVTTPLWMLRGIEPYLSTAYWVAVIGTIVVGILTLVLQGCTASAWMRCKVALSLTASTACVVLFTVSRQPYAAMLAFCLLAIQATVLIQRR